MGLDTYAYYGGLSPQATAEGDNMMPDHLFPPNRLCGGLFSGGGASFRGKVYNEWIEWCTNGKYTLYTEELSENQVRDIYDALYRKQEDTYYKQFVRETGSDITYGQTIDLLKWFEIVVDNKGVVVGWW
jgi:hypothetical protein